MTHYFGSHMLLANESLSLITLANNLKKAGGNMMQIFINQPGNIDLTKKPIKELKEFNQFLKNNDMKVVVHGSYRYNFARNWDKNDLSIISLTREIKYASIIGAIGVVIHFGKKLDLTLPEAYNNMFSAVLHIHNQTKEYSDVKILLETSTGQGTEICYTLDSLAYFYKKFKQPELKKRIQLCIDTCHVFSAGYNLKTPTNVKMFIEAFEELIGFNYVGLIHLNDSKVKLGARVDRHANIGKGYIGKKGLKVFFNYIKKLHIPCVLETPNYGYKTEINLLMS